MILLIHVLDTKKRAPSAEEEKHILEPKKNNLLLTEDSKCLNAHKCACHYSKRIFKTHNSTTPELFHSGQFSQRGYKARTIYLYHTVLFFLSKDQELGS